MAARVDVADGGDEILRVVALAEVALGATLDGLGGEHRIIVHAEHEDPRFGIADQQPARQLEAGNVRQVDVDDRYIRALRRVDLLRGGRVAGLEHVACRWSRPAARGSPTARWGDRRR